MKKLFSNVITLLLLLFIGTSDLLAAEAKSAKIVMTTDAPAGTELRIAPNSDIVQDIIVSGADKGKYTYIYLSKGPGSEITITFNDPKGIYALSQLEVYGCQLTSLNIVEAPDLFILKCYNNKLKELNVASCPKLEVLDCKDNQLQKLDVSHNNILEQLYASNNKLTELNIGNQQFLKYLDCANNTLETLDISGCPILEELHFNDCKLNNLNLSQNKKLSWVFAYNNGIAGDKMTQFIANMPEGFNSQIFIVDTFADSESNVCTMDDVREFAKKSWVTMDYINGGGGESQLGRFYPGCDYVPTVSESKITFTTSRAAGEKVTLYISSDKSLIIDGVKEPVATGKNTYTLTASTVTISGDVSAFECTDNDITSLTFTDPTVLTRLECQNNHITKLDIKNAKALTQLLAENNNISSLNLSGCNALVRVNCYQNNLHGPKMTAFVNSLCTSSAEPLLFIIDTTAKNEHNVANTNQVNIAKEKGWDVLDYKGGDRYGSGVSYKGSEPTGDELPDEYFTFSKSSIGVIMPNITFCDAADNDPKKLPTVEGAEVKGWNGTVLTLNMTEETVTIYGDIETIKFLFQVVEEIDVTALPQLKELNIALNDIATIDLTNNAELETFSCEGNLIEALDFSGNPNLRYINCYGNKIKGENMTKMMQSLPQLTQEDYGTLIVHDASYTHNANICLKSDVAIAHSKFWVPCEIDENDKAVPYDGEDPAGIEDITLNNTLQYNNGIIYLATPSTIEVYNAAGILTKKADNACELSVEDLPAGLYIVRADSQTLKIVK